MTERCLSFDLEWAADRSERLVCFQACELLPDGTTAPPVLLPAWAGCDREARAMFGDALLSPDWILLGQNVAGDLRKLAGDWGLLREIEAKYKAGGVRCTLLRQRLIDVAWPGRMVWRPLRPKKRKEVEGAPDLDEVDESQEDVVGGQRGFWDTVKVAPHATLGELQFKEADEGGGRGMQAKAGLEALVLRYRGRDPSLRVLLGLPPSATDAEVAAAMADEKKGADSYRLRYGELIGIPVDDWPEKARRYALNDPVLTAWVCADQGKRPGPPYAGPWCDVLYPKPGSVPWAPLRCERFEEHAHLWFADMERVGLMRDQPRVERMRGILHRAAESAEVVAVRSGVVRLDVKHDASAAAETGLRVMQVKHDRAAAKAAGLTPAETREIFARAREAVSARREDEVSALVAAHPWLSVEHKRDSEAIHAVYGEAKRLAHARDMEALDALAASTPWLTVSRVRDDKQILERAVAAYKAAGMREMPRTKTGNVSAAAEHVVQAVTPAPDASERAAEDLRALLSPDLLTHLQRWTEAGEHQRIIDALACASDPGLASHVARQKAQTFDTAFLAALDTRHRLTDPDRWKDPEGPAKFGVSPFKATARTGLRGDLRQNMPKAKDSVRECFVPRPGRVLLCVDYAACEMSTFADALDELVVWGLYGKTGGISTLGQAIRGGMDCHLKLAATMRREPYDQLVAFYKSLKTKIEANDIALVSKGELAAWYDLDLDRAGAKEGNFGYGGGMGARKFARLQRKKGRHMTEDQARRIREAWYETWSPEVPDYAALASAATGDRGIRKSATVVHGGGGHVRGGLDYCAWMNTHFQEKAARGAKRSMILLGRACRLDESSPLYRRADPVLFIHDEFILEADAEFAEECLAEQMRLMGLGMNSVVRTPVKREGKILRERWTK